MRTPNLHTKPCRSMQARRVHQCRCLRRVTPVSHFFRRHAVRRRNRCNGRGRWRRDLRAAVTDSTDLQRLVLRPAAFAEVAAGHDDQNEHRTTHAARDTGNQPNLASRRRQRWWRRQSHDLCHLRCRCRFDGDAKRSTRIGGARRKGRECVEGSVPCGSGACRNGCGDSDARRLHQECDVVFAHTVETGGETCLELGLIEGSHVACHGVSCLNSLHRHRTWGARRGCRRRRWR